MNKVFEYALEYGFKISETEPKITVWAKNHL